MKHHPDISDMRVTEKGFQCKVKGITYNGKLNKAGHLSALAGNNSDIEFSTPIEGTLTGSVLLNVHHMLAHVPTPPTDEVREFSSPDGVRFFFTTKNGAESQAFIAMPDILLNVIEQPGLCLFGMEISRKSPC